MLCMEYGMNLSARIKSNDHGDIVATLLSRMWARDLQRLYNIYAAVGDPGYRFTSGDIASDTGLPELASAARSLLGPIAQRLAQLWAL